MFLYNPPALYPPPDSQLPPPVLTAVVAVSQRVMHAFFVIVLKGEKHWEVLVYKNVQ